MYLHMREAVVGSADYSCHSRIYVSMAPPQLRVLSKYNIVNHFEVPMYNECT